MTPVYMNHAYTGLPRSPAAVAAVRALLDAMASPDPAVHVASIERAHAAVEEARRAAARLIGAPHGRLHLAPSTTAAINAALRGHLRRGDRVVTTDWDHFAVGRPLLRLERDHGVVVERVASRADGSLDADGLRAALGRGARLLAVTHACNVTGAVFDLALASELAREAGAALLVDAAATAGAVPIDVARDEPAFLAFGAHKRLCALPGAAALFVGEGYAIPPLADGTVAGFEGTVGLAPDAAAPPLAGTPAVLACAALAAAAGEPRPALESMCAAMLDRLAALDGWRLLGPPLPAPRVPIFALVPRAGSLAGAARRLRDHHGVVATSGSCNAPWIHRALGTETEGILRVSPGAATTPDDVERTVYALAEVV